MIYTGESISSSEALACGLVERVVPLHELDQAVEQWTQAMLEAGPRALRLQKALIRQWESLPLDQAIHLGIESFADAYDTDEPRRMMEGFLARRRKKPDTGDS